MMVPIVQVAVLVVLTHVFRAIVLFAGPRRSGLLMGLPSTTAVVLVCSGLERGLPEATGAAEACLIGLVAAASVPLVYARCVAARWPLPWIPCIAIAGYLGVAGVLRGVPAAGPWECVAVAVFGVVIACILAQRRRKRSERFTAETVLESSPRLPRSSWISRSAVPASYFLAVRGMRSLAGPNFAGMFITCPGTSLAVLVTTHLEAGPGAACRMAAAMPMGSLCMLSFLSVFRFGIPRLGLTWGTALAYLVALATLFAVERISRLHESIQGRRWLSRELRAARTRFARFDPALGWAITGRASARRASRFLPIVERLAC